jgi:hypothetical protein
VIAKVASNASSIKADIGGFSANYQPPEGRC